MPSTVRVSIAQRNDTQVIEEAWDQVINSEVGAHTTWALPPTLEGIIGWPIGPNYQSAYLIFYNAVLPVTIRLKMEWDDTGSTFTVPAGVRTPMLLQKPSNGRWYMTASADVLLAVFYY